MANISGILNTFVYNDLVIRDQIPMFVGGGWLMRVSACVIAASCRCKTAKRHQSVLEIHGGPTILKPASAYCAPLTPLNCRALVTGPF